MQKVEARPNSEPRQAVLAEELETAQACQDAEVVKGTQALLDLLKQHGQEAAVSYHAELHGSGAIAQRSGAAAADEGGMAISGDGNVVGDQSSSNVRKG